MATNAASTTAGHRLRRTTARRPWIAQLLLFLGVYALYGAERWIAKADAATALQHTEWLVSFERGLGVFVEGSVQQALDGGVSHWLLDHVYLGSELVVLPLVLVWLYRRDSEQYTFLRNTILVTWALAVPIFALFPVAPPRLADLGIADTVSAGSVPMQSRMVTPFYNPYAAIPSLHCGFALAVGIAVFRDAGPWWLRTAGLAWMSVVALATVVTGNHFVADVIAGLALTVLGWSIATSARCAKAIHTAQAFLAEPLPFRRSADRQRRWPNIARPAS